MGDEISPELELKGKVQRNYKSVKIPPGVSFSPLCCSVNKEACAKDTPCTVQI